MNTVQERAREEPVALLNPQNRAVSMYLLEQELLKCQCETRTEDSDFVAEALSQLLLLSFAMSDIPLACCAPQLHVKLFL